MKTAPFTFDRRLYELLQEEGFSKFTTRDLRDAYAKRFADVDFNLGDVRLFVYEQIRRMLRAGWITLDEDRRKRGQIYHLRACPKNLRLELVDGVFEKNLKGVVKAEHGSSAGKDSIRSAPSLNTAQHLQSLLKEVRLDFLSAMGEAERYKQLLGDMPELREKVEDDYLEARDRSSRLLGHLRAVEKTLKTLAATQ
tara:strand:+ start:21033 stop:21620 length:588 start_codon:yes stop_codon:yes gene_type:complete